LSLGEGRHREWRKERKKHVDGWMDGWADGGLRERHTDTNRYIGRLICR
jgi:hypothetical protein